MQSDQTQPQTSVAAHRQSGTRPNALDREELSRLVSRLAATLDGKPGRMVQLLAPARGAGVSTIARSLAQAVYERFEEPVLLLDADTTRAPASASQLPEFGPRGLIDSLETKLPPEQAIRQAPDGNFEIARLLAEPLRRGHVLPASQLDEVVGQLRGRYRWIIVDSAPVSESTESISLARVADAVLLVAEAEATRLPVVQQLVDELRAAGAEPHGLVVNKRRFYIPDWFYRWI